MNKTASFLIALFLFFSCSHTNKQSNKEEETTPVPVEAAGKEYIPALSPELIEISGLMYWKNLYWGFNDSGGSPVLFGFDENGEIQQKIVLTNAENRDWESVTQDSLYIYLGDFGNNWGNRKNLCVYKIRKQDVTNDELVQLEAGKINFNYARQNEFVFNINSTPFDCEAMVEFNGNLYLFSKNWQDKTTERYKLPKSEGVYQSEAQDSFNVNLLVTGADISPDKSKLALIGYFNYQTYLWVFSEFKGDDFFGRQSLYLHLKNLDGSQTEGVCFKNNDMILISCEETNSFPQQVFQLDLNEIADGTYQGKR